MNTSTFDAAAHPREQRGRFTDKTNTAPSGSLSSDRDLAAETPVAIDEEIAELYYAEGRVLMTIDAHGRSIERYEKYLENERSSYTAARYQETIDRDRAAIDELKRELQELRDQMRPLQAEYERRGRWSRAFLVSGGHLHSSMSCSTCNREGKLTRFAWMTDYSGASEAEIVDAASARACTTCFPSAPTEVLNRPSTLLTPDEKEAAEARAAREEERARRAAEKDAKAITNPDGTPLRLGYLEARTLVTAERELVEALSDIELNEARPFGNPDYATGRREWAELLTSAIAHKKGIHVDDVTAAAMEKARKKAAKILRSWG